MQLKRVKLGKEALSVAVTDNNTMDAPNAQFFKKSFTNNNFKLIEAEVNNGNIDILI